MFTSKAATAIAATAAMPAVMNRSLRSLGFLSVLIAIRVFLQRTGFRMIGHDVTGCRVSHVEVAADAGNGVRIMRPGNGGRNLRMATPAGGSPQPTETP